MLAPRTPARPLEEYGADLSIEHWGSQRDHASGVVAISSAVGRAGTAIAPRRSGGRAGGRATASRRVGHSGGPVRGRSPRSLGQVADGARGPPRLRPAPGAVTTLGHAEPHRDHEHGRHQGGRAHGPRWPHLPERSAAAARGEPERTAGRAADRRRQPLRGGARQPRGLHRTSACATPAASARSGPSRTRSYWGRGWTSTGERFPPRCRTRAPSSTKATWSSCADRSARAVECASSTGACVATRGNDRSAAAT